MSKMILQTASATQMTTEGRKGEWVVNSADGEALYELPKHWDEKDVMKAIHFARYFERRIELTK